MQPPARSLAATLPIIWVAFVGSQLMFLGFSFVNAPTPTAGEGVAPLFGIGSLILGALSVLAGRLPRAAEGMATLFMVRFAFAEAASLFGFVAHFLTGDRVVQLACAAIGLLAHAMAFPSASALAPRPGGRR